LYALQAVIIHARYLAYTNNDTQLIAAILDEAEYLAGLVAVRTDETENYKRQLIGISERFNFKLAFERFDKEM